MVSRIGIGHKCGDVGSNVVNFGGRHSGEGSHFWIVAVVVAIVLGNGIADYIPRISGIESIALRVAQYIAVATGAFPSVAHPNGLAIACVSDRSSSLYC